MQAFCTPHKSERQIKLYATVVYYLDKWTANGVKRDSALSLSNQTTNIIEMTLSIYIIYAPFHSLSFLLLTAVTTMIFNGGLRRKKGVHD